MSTTALLAAGVISAASFSEVTVTAAPASESVHVKDKVTAVALEDTVEFQATKKYIFFKKGELPLILEAPHDGTVEVTGATKRDVEGGGRDTNVSLLVQRVSERLRTMTGKRPTVLLLLAKREYVGANSPPGSGAYADAKTKTIYDHYYALLEQAARDIATTHRSGFVFSVHCGGNLGPADMYFGTNGGRTVRAMRNKWGDDAFDGPKGLPALVAAKGYRVPGQKGLPPHNGWTGPIVAMFTQRKPTGLDGAQLEIERILFMHDTSKRNKLADDLAAALVAFLKECYGVK